VWCYLRKQIVSKELSQEALNRAFVHGRSVSAFTPQAVDDALLQRVVALSQWGATAFNMQPARYVFVKSAAAKAKLKPTLMAGNQDKSMAAPVTVIVAMDTRFYEHLPAQFPAFDAAPMFASNPAAAQAAAFRNSSLQGAYFMIAARMLGLDCGPMSGFDSEALNAAFFPDGRYKANFLVNLGYGDASGNYPRGPRLSFADVASVV
jgi:3-hydroxypropanoate dehydrogenase